MSHSQEIGVNECGINGVGDRIASDLGCCMPLSSADVQSLPDLVDRMLLAIVTSYRRVRIQIMSTKGIRDSVVRLVIKVKSYDYS